MPDIEQTARDVVAAAFQETINKAARQERESSTHGDHRITPSELMQAQIGLDAMERAYTAEGDRRILLSGWRVVISALHDLVTEGYAQTLAEGYNNPTEEDLLHGFFERLLGEVGGEAILQIMGEDWSYILQMVDEIQQHIEAARQALRKPEKEEEPNA